MTASDSRAVHRNPWFSVTHRHDPDTGGGAGWFRVVRPDSAICIPMTEDGEIVFIRGIRDTVGGAAQLELPSGTIEEDESPSQAATRETKEETGFLVANLSPLGWFVESPGISGARCYGFVADTVSSSQASLEPGEAWRVETHHRSHVRKLIRDGEIRDGASLACLALLEAQA